jgi:hypothetical protein
MLLALGEPPPVQALDPPVTATRSDGLKQYSPVAALRRQTQGFLATTVITVAAPPDTVKAQVALGLLTPPGYTAMKLIAVTPSR